MMDKMKSRKLWMAIIGAILPVIASLLTGAIDMETACKASSAIICTYLIGQGYTDGKTMEGWTPPDEVKAEVASDGEA